jgi:acylphosphatase
VRVLITGRVQDVGFRQWAAHRARALGLRGWVRNRPDGTVEAAAEGPAHALDAWLRDLRDGPPMARVESVAPAFEAAAGEFTGFEVR